MIKQLQSRSRTSDKANRYKFIAFQNQRDNLGRVIKPRSNKKASYNIMQLFQNLKKSTKQYFFQKEFQKMQKKFQHMKKSLEDDKDYDYQKQIDKCIQILSKAQNNKQEGDRNKQNLYINLRDQIDKKIVGVTQGLNKMRKQKQNCQTVKQRHIQKQFHEDRQKINSELFKGFSPRSKMMADFCEKGLEYQKYVQQKKYDPWKTWYKKYEYQLFPGKKIKVKCLQKSIYQ